ncbi:MAG TPA: GDSL-type esterase/lipase family protein [Kiritimatiellia bacterium]|nr:GDSL-type esterase/lipase family protein [Kiritimatiellia bacterium]HRZ11042.1 GDSL-type esterase/lipase family protein [Kiritimatiellia bacterium]HSA18615.1 GDSL-type esterase/lipase family protein [Kiritimatiellia bacterium]
MKPIVKSIILRVVLMLFVLFCALAALELALRLRGPMPESIKQTPLFDRSRFYFASDAERIHPWVRDTNHVLRVAIVGDSFTTGQGVQPDDTFGMRLERLLNLKKDATPAAVDVFAKGGTSTYMQRGFLDEALATRPRLVILAMYLNDTENFNNYKELRAWRTEMMPPVPTGWLAPLIRRSRALAWFNKKIGDVKSGRGFHRYYERLYDDDYSGWKLFQDAARDFHKACRDQQVEFLVVIWPCLSFVDRTPYPFQFAHDKIIAHLQSENIRYLDLLDSLRGRSPTRMETLPGADGHPSEIAHRIAAEAIFHYLLNEGLVDAAYIPRNEALQLNKYWEAMYERMAKPESARSEVEPQAPVE